MAEVVYHVELRQFPNNLCRFNLSEGELRAMLVEPWIHDRLVDLGERKWDPQKAKLTVLEGPRLEAGELTMGRGWRAAQRRGRDVTEMLLAAARGEAGGEMGGGAGRGPQGGVRGAEAGGRLPQESGGRRPEAGGREPGGREAGGPAAPSGDPSADSLGLELLARLGAGPLSLADVWELAEQHRPGASASASLALAEQALDSLLRRGLVVLLRRDTAEGESRELGTNELTDVLGASASWAPAEIAGVYLRRA